MRPFIALAALCLAPLAGQQAHAQIDRFGDIQELRDQTPSCASRPDAPIIGRVSGTASGAISGREFPVSFVGCFYDMATCERWKGRTSRPITSTLIQYSCRPR